MMYTMHYNSPLGGILLAAGETGLTGLWFDGATYFADTLDPLHKEQAVGGAVGHNAISIIIPCHRVVGSNGSLTGYAGGIERKIELLTLEKACMDSLFVPAKGAAL